jgi:DNA-directed RNA polymerase subunit RPC12/RpoP
MEQKCQTCGEVLLLSYQDGYAGVGQNKPPPIENEGDKRFVRCPVCDAKNILIVQTKAGLPQMVIVRAE